MAWGPQGRDLPGNWGTLRVEVFKRDGWRCRAILPSGARCPRGRATGHPLQCDHINGRNDHSMTNLQTLCETHHKRKTGREAFEARSRRQGGAGRRGEEHPSARRREP